MPWNRITMSNDEMLSGKADKLQSRFAKLWIGAGVPPGAIMYAFREADRQHHYFFTPHAVKIAESLLKSFGAVDCEKPGGLALVVLVKNEGSGVRG